MKFWSAGVIQKKVIISENSKRDGITALVEHISVATTLQQRPLSSVVLVGCYIEASAEKSQLYQLEMAAEARSKRKSETGSGNSDHWS